MTAYYNEIDKNAAAWLRNLIAAGHIAPGIVDERSIEDVVPTELMGFTQCHFFAGIGVWSHALRSAGWPDSRPVWTGSCPCQPFSAAGKGAGFDDERHLWPAFQHLISQCCPEFVFGEQVDAALKSGWWDLVANDLEALDYATAAAVIPASAVGAPHMRHRLFFVAKCGVESYNRANAPHSKDRNGNKNLSQMPTGKAAGSILLGETIGGREALLLQAVRQGPAHHIPDGLVRGAMGGPQDAAQEPCAQGAGLLASAQDDLPGEGAGPSGQAAGSEEGRPVRLGPARGSLAGADQCRILRTDGDSVPTGRVEEFRQPLAGSHSAGTWVHVCQREGCLLCDELRAGNMGRSASALDIGSMEEEKGNLKNDAIDVIQAHGKNDNDTWGQADSGNQGIGAPHIRDRTYWVANTGSTRTRRDAGAAPGAQSGLRGARNSDGSHGSDALIAGGAVCGLADTNSHGCSAGHGIRLHGAEHDAEHGGGKGAERPGPVNGFWRAADWLGCRDDKWRAVEPGTFPLVAGLPRSMGQMPSELRRLAKMAGLDSKSLSRAKSYRIAGLKGYGNAINAQAAQAFIEAVMESA